MNKSNFQFSNPHIEKIDFRVNDAAVDSDNLPISINIQNDIFPEGNKSITKLNLSQQPPVQLVVYWKP